jgi:hypothetical protein
LLLQSRGHYLTGGVREKHFNLFKQWAQVQTAALWARIGFRYVVYGEWLYAKHTVFYDALPHYFLEFDLYIKVEEEGTVVERYKYIRPAFLPAVFAAEGHWLSRPIIPNLLQDGADLFRTV